MRQGYISRTADVNIFYSEIIFLPASEKIKKCFKFCPVRFPTCERVGAAHLPHNPTLDPLHPLRHLAFNVGHQVFQLGAGAHRNVLRSIHVEP